MTLTDQSQHKMQQLIDPFNRKINYLRVSVTDHCNYRCFYCRDEYHTTNTERMAILSYEELARIIKIFSELGITKVRLTGGEPLIRKDICKLTQMISGITNINDIPLSTNAHLLAPMAHKLRISGINRVNISIDSLNKKRFTDITKGGNLDKVIAGIDAAITEGLNPIKLNMVVMKGINDDEIEPMIDFAIDRNIDIRFIEAMPIGVAGVNAIDNYYSESLILKRINTYLPAQLTSKITKQTSGPAKEYNIKNTNSSVGVISAMSDNFCDSCNRVRLTAKGQLILCLGQKDSISLRDLVRSEKDDAVIKTEIIKAINKKPKQHNFNTKIGNITVRQMVEIGG